MGCVSFMFEMFLTLVALITGLISALYHLFGG